MSQLIDEDLTREIIGGAIEVHRHWGPGLYEEVYERSLARELVMRGLIVDRQVPAELMYKGEAVGDSLRVDLMVAKKVIVEVKAVVEILPIHEAQVLTYLRLTGCKVGLLFNFNVVIMTQGLRRFVV